MLKLKVANYIKKMTNGRREDVLVVEGECTPYRIALCREKKGKAAEKEVK